MPDPRFLFTLPGIPRRLISRLAGRVAKLPLPKWLRSRAWKFLANKFGMDPSTLPSDISVFPRFLDLFCRPLPEGCRPIAEGKDWLAPSDGQVVAVARFNPEGSFLIKGCPYSTSELLPNITHQELDGYNMTQIYLSPKDYHRFHAPTTLEISSAVSFPGDLQPVDPLLARRSLRVLAKNRRVLLNCLDQDGNWFGLIFVGALNVGEMRFTFDPSLGLAPMFKGERRYDPLPKLERGEELGRFEFGSTILMVTPPHLEPLFKLNDSTQVRGSMYQVSQ